MTFNVTVYRYTKTVSWSILEEGTEVEWMINPIFENVCATIKADIKKLNNPEDYGWCIVIDNETHHCDSFEYTIQKGWIDTLYINYDLVKRLNELMK